jgi:hypothetical protein
MEHILSLKSFLAFAPVPDAGSTALLFIVASFSMAASRFRKIKASASRE